MGMTGCIVRDLKTIIFLVLLAFNFIPQRSHDSLTLLRSLFRGPKGAPLLYLYKVSIVVLINFIAILLTPDIFLIQIVNTNNTNIYLIHFHRKNSIKMRFPKVEFLKFQTRFKHSLSIVST